MPAFEYRALNTTGVEVTNVIDAPNSTAVAESLEKLGYLPLTIKPKQARGNIELFSKKKKIKAEQVIVFTRQLFTLLKAGVPLLSCLEVLVVQTEHEAFKEVIQSIYVDIESGISFSEALSKHPKVFSALYINSIKAGEMGGALDDVLQRMTLLMEHDQETRARIKAAMRYPIIVVVSLVVAFITLMILVVPKFIALFQEVGANLPLPTRLLIGFHSLLAHYWYILLAVLAVLYFALVRYIKTEKGALQWDYLKINLPVLGDLNLKTAMSRFTRMFETLNSSGLPILQTLDIVSKTVGNKVVGKAIEKASMGIIQGQGIAEPLSESKMFPPMVIRMISIGEQSGALDDMLLSISKHYDTEVDYAVKNLTAMIEPILTVAMGVIVLFLALAIFLPMWDLTKLAQ
ncbi:MAG: type II secretion system F family protein [bacterium]